MIVKKETESYEQDKWEFTGVDAVDMYELLISLDSFVCKLIELNYGEAIEINPDNYQPPYFYIGSGEDMIFVCGVGSWKEFRVLCDEYYVAALEALWGEQG